MKPLFSRPRYDLTSTAIILALLGVLFMVIAPMADAIFQVPAFLLGLGYTFLALGIWQESRVALMTTAIVMGLTALQHIVKVFVGDSPIKSALLGVGFSSFAYSCLSAFRKLRVTAKEGSQFIDDEDEAQEDDEDRPMISIVLLQRAPKYLEAEMLGRIIESVWDGIYTDEDSEDPENFVVGESPIFMIRSEGEMFVVHNHDAEYFGDSKEEVADSVGELRLAKAIRDHTAWLSVDFMGDIDDAALAYPKIIHLVEALADEDTLLVYRPETNDVYVWSDEIASQLLEEGFDALGQVANVPVIPISGEHPLMVRAYERAKEGLPEFIEQFNRRDENDENFVIKIKITVDEVTEFIWADVIGFEPNYVHATLANDPVDLGDLRLHDQVEASHADIYDWGYVRADQHVGFFTVEAIREIQSEE